MSVHKTLFLTVSCEVFFFGCWCRFVLRYLFACLVRFGVMSQGLACFCLLRELPVSFSSIMESSFFALSVSLFPLFWVFM